MDNQSLENIPPMMLGMFNALVTALRAFSKTHPNPDALIAAFRFYHAETIASFARDNLSQNAVEAYYVLLRDIAPNPDEWLTM